MAKRKQKRKPAPEARRPQDVPAGQRTNRREGKAILTHSVGALPIINRLLERMRLEELLDQHLPPEDNRTKVKTSRVLLLFLRNLLVSREPVYGVAEWARNFSPELFGLGANALEHLNDDRGGRALEQACLALESSLIMDVVSHVVQEFQVGLDEFHNDSTTVTFFGAYPDAQSEQRIQGQLLPAITWGHNKDHRPDLKQLLYILTVTDDGGIPVYFQAASGNVVDNETHQTTWRLLQQLVQRPDFVYVADCKLATTDNMNAIARENGRFISVLPATRKENTEFRRKLLEQPATTTWKEAYRKLDEDGELIDVFHVCDQEHLSKEGYRLLWFHSRSKQDADGVARAKSVQRTIRELMDLQARLEGPRTRFRRRDKVAAAVDTILDAHEAGPFLQVNIEENQAPTYRQSEPGRPTETTKYRRRARTRYHLTWQIKAKELEEAAAGDGVFPLITNLTDWDASRVLQAYKRQPIIEKRFSQLKTDFSVAPVYLKNVRRIVGILVVYFFALMVQALLERELRNAMKSGSIYALPLYPEGRPCSRPTTRRVLDVFEPIARHTIITPENRENEVFTTELAPIHRSIIKLLRVPLSHYQA